MIQPGSFKEIVFIFMITKQKREESMFPLAKAWNYLLPKIWESFSSYLVYFSNMEANQENNSQLYHYFHWTVMRCQQVAKLSTEYRNEVPSTRTMTEVKPVSARYQEVQIQALVLFKTALCRRGVQTHNEPHKHFDCARLEFDSSSKENMRKSMGEPAITQGSLQLRKKRMR